MCFVQWLIEPCLTTFLLTYWQVELILDNLTFNFNSLFGIVYVSFSMQFPTVEECDFDQQFLFDEYVAISHRYDLKIVSLKS
jgi:hypothetical protein